MDALDNVVDPLRNFAKDSVRLVKRCHKLDRKVGGDISSAQAVLLGALAHGVNVGPNMEYTKINVSDVGFLEQTSLVSIEHQMQEMDLIAKDHVIEHKENHIGDTLIISSSSLPSPYVCSSRTQLGVGSDGLSVTLGIVAATGLGLLAFSEVETVLQLVGSAIIIQLLSKKLLFAEDLWLGKALT
ncbi:Protein transport protein Sec61 subunit gamma [Hibiscus syriacus]|uniref:Protein transport protein Sec61 subunit gamma n=1 Tax=Hibiscus syriacus TaxID=106335 RepID=A0A6A2WIN7_HIBSY|nr:Protein transport protein Sec61 subunit gamma [Hibiscus syriacus]